MPSKRKAECFFCGTELEAPEAVLTGERGSICRGCVFALAARLSEPDLLSSLKDGASGQEQSPDKPAREERSAHDYQTRIDLAAAYLEMGRTGAAVSELLAATESAIFCADYQTALRCAARARRIADGPSLRDRICEIFTRMAPPEESNG
ncbi:MAG: hypothetical protein ABI333_03750 [bacterium]